MKADIADAQVKSSLGFYEFLVVKNKVFKILTSKCIVGRSKSLMTEGVQLEGRSRYGLHD